MHKLFHKIKGLRTNENILIAVDALYGSKSSFMGIFLMSFMISVSLRNSPVSFLTYELTHYAFCGILCILLANILRAHPLGTWRASMFFNIVQILAVIIIDPNCTFYPLIIGFLVGLEAQLYWRPKNFLEIKEVSNTRRDHFNAIRQVLNELIKIAMPVILGIVISDTSYARASVIILAISTVQLLLSILFHPTHSIKIQSHPLRESLRFAVAHKQIRRTLWLQTLRGFAMSGCAYAMVAQLNIYNSTITNAELGGLQAAESAIAILVILLYRHYEKKAPIKSDMLVYSLLPAAILLPITAYFFPGNYIIAIVFFVYTQAIVVSLYSSTIFSVFHQNEIKKAAHDDAYRIEIEILSELWLCFGRVLSIVPLLALFYFGLSDWVLPLVAVQAIAIPIAIAFIYKSATSRAASTH